MFTYRRQCLLVHMPAFALSPCATRYSSGTSEYWQPRDGAALHSLDWSATHEGTARSRAGKAGGVCHIDIGLYWSPFAVFFIADYASEITRK